MAGTTTLCRSQLYPPVRDYEFGLLLPLSFLLVISSTPPLSANTAVIATSLSSLLLFLLSLWKVEAISDVAGDGGGGGVAASDKNVWSSLLSCSTPLKSQLL
jgi:hypothetical protein